MELATLTCALSQTSALLRRCFTLTYVVCKLVYSPFLFVCSRAGL